MDEKTIQAIAAATAERVAADLAPFLLGILDGSGVDAPEARSALLALIAGVGRAPRETIGGEH